MALENHPQRTTRLIILVLLSITPLSMAGYEWILDQSTVFADDALEVNICFGDVNNDGSIDMVIGKHKDYSTGRTAAFQQTTGGWDAGTQFYSGGNGNVHPIVGEINGHNRLVVNYHVQSNYGGNLQFRRYDSDFNLVSSYSVALTHPYFSDQVLVGETVYFNTRGQLAKAEWADLAGGFAATELADDGEGNKLTTIDAEDLTGDGVQEIIYWTYDGSTRGLNILVNEIPVEIAYGFTAIFTTGQFDPNSAVHEVFYANNADDTFNLVRYNSDSQTFVSQVVLNQQLENPLALAPFDINGDGTDEVLFATAAGEIYEFDLVNRQLKTVLTSNVYWYDSVVDDWGDGKKAVFVGSENGDVSVVAFDRDRAVIANMAGNVYPQNTPIDVAWVFNGPSTQADVQVRSVGAETWTTMATVSALSGFCEIPGLVESAYDLRLADAADNNIVYGQTGTFEVYTCTQTLAGDLDGDCYVDLIDFDLLSAGYVDFNNFITFVEDWLQCANPYDDGCN